MKCIFVVEYDIGEEEKLDDVNQKYGCYYEWEEVYDSLGAHDFLDDDELLHIS